MASTCGGNTGASDQQNPRATCDGPCVTFSAGLRLLLA